MKKPINIKADNATEILKNINDSLGEDLTQEHLEYCFSIPASLGKGHIKAFDFNDEIGVLGIDILTKQDWVLQFKKNIFNPLFLIFNLEQSFEYNSTEDTKPNTIRQFENIIVSNDMKSHFNLTLKENKAYGIFMIVLNRKNFEKKIEAFIPTLNPDLENLLRDANGINHFYYKGLYSLDIAKSIEEFKNSEMDELMTSIYREGKAYEVLTFQMQQYIDDLNDPENRKILRKSTMDRIKEAVNEINSDLAANLNVNALAKKVGLNQNTLQSGFKRMFDSSVNDYIRSRRIEKAKDLLENSDHSIKEITYMIGISSRSYFSKLFKQTYHISPSEYIKKTRNSKSA